MKVCPFRTLIGCFITSDLVMNLKHYINRKKYQDVSIKYQDVSIKYQERDAFGIVLLCVEYHAWGQVRERCINSVLITPNVLSDGDKQV
jgi:hypothetical protein